MSRICVGWELGPFYDENTQGFDSMVQYLQIEVMKRKHIKAIVNIHSEELDTGILNYFGKDFLERMYTKLLETNWGFVAQNQHTGKVVGFIISFQEQVSLLKCLSIGSSTRFFFTVLLNWKKLKAFWIALNKFHLNSEKHYFKNSIELIHFAVSEPYKGKRIGSSLLVEFEQRAIKEGYSSIHTRTGNPRLVNFYQKSKGALIVDVTPLGTYVAHLLQWEI